MYAAKNKREAKFVLLENMVDFWIMVMGMIYITIVYKVYRYDTFLSGLNKEQMAEQFFTMWYRSTATVPDHVFLLIIYYTYVLKAIL